MNNYLRYAGILVAGAILLIILSGLYERFTEVNTPSSVSISSVLADSNAGKVRSLTISGNKITGVFNNGSVFESYGRIPESTFKTLVNKGININMKPPTSPVPSLLSILISWFPILLIIGIWIYLMRGMTSASGKSMGFGKSKAKMLSETPNKTTFEDVAGIDEAKEDLQEIVDFLKDPEKFQKLGGRIPRGVLLVGLPGTGKTLLAKAIAGEAHVPFFTISGSEFVEMFVGVGASRVRDMFEQAKKNSPCIVFIDEIDAVGRHRGAGLGGGNDEREQTLNQLLVEMDGFETNESVILIAATNRPDVLDPALLRPGRFDRQITVPLPDITGREKVLKVHAKKILLAPDVNLKVVARGTPGFSGADLMNLVNESALMAARRNKKMVTMSDFEEAKDRILMGPERRTLVMGDDERKLTAYHEAGHALVAVNVAGSHPIHKATIIPRGRSLGMVMQLPTKDQVSQTRSACKAQLAVAMGGRVAEEIIFGYDKVTTGASSDIAMATKLSRAMVTKYGMSDKLGPLAYSEESEEVFLGHSVAKNKSVADETQKVVDSEIKCLVEEGYNTANKILTDKIDKLHLLANALLEEETLSGEDINNLLKGKKLDKKEKKNTSINTGLEIPEAGKDTSNKEYKTKKENDNKTPSEPQTSPT